MHMLLHAYHIMHWKPEAAPLQIKHALYANTWLTIMLQIYVHKYTLPLVGRAINR